MMRSYIFVLLFLNLATLPIDLAFANSEATAAAEKHCSKDSGLKKACVQLANAVLQTFNVKTSEEAKKVSHVMSDATFCVHDHANEIKMSPREASDLVDKVIGEMTSTKERVTAFLDYNGKIPGGVYSQPPAKTSCR